MGEEICVELPPVNPLDIYFSLGQAGIWEPSSEVSAMRAEGRLDPEVYRGPAGQAWFGLGCGFSGYRQHSRELTRSCHEWMARISHLQQKTFYDPDIGAGG